MCFIYVLTACVAVVLSGKEPFEHGWLQNSTYGTSVDDSDVFLEFRKGKSKDEAKLPQRSCPRDADPGDRWWTTSSSRVPQLHDERRPPGNLALSDSPGAEGDDQELPEYKSREASAPREHKVMVKRKRTNFAKVTPTADRKGRPEWLSSSLSGVPQQAAEYVCYKEHSSQDSLDAEGNNQGDPLRWTREWHDPARPELSQSLFCDGRSTPRFPQQEARWEPNTKQIANELPDTQEGDRRDVDEQVPRRRRLARKGNNHHGSVEPSRKGVGKEGRRLLPGCLNLRVEPEVGKKALMTILQMQKTELET